MNDKIIELNEEPYQKLDSGKTQNKHSNIKNKPTIFDLIKISKGNQHFQKKISLIFALTQILLGIITMSLLLYFTSVKFNCISESGGK